MYVVYEYRRYLPYFIGEITGGTLYGGHPTRCSRQDSARTLCAIESALPFLGACQSRRHDGLRTQIREQPQSSIRYKLLDGVTEMYNGCNGYLHPMFRARQPPEYYTYLKSLYE